MTLTEKERSEINVRMLELYGYSFDECEELSYKCRKIKVWNNNNHTPLTKLDRVAYTIRSKRKNMGTDKGYKYTYETVWSDRITRREYIKRMEEMDPIQCGLFLCGLERFWMNDDTWWDTPDYRQTAIKEYRARISAIRVKYGLSARQAQRYMYLN